MKTAAHKGSALVPALLIVAITAGLAAGLASRLDSGLQYAIYRRDEVQARQLARAAIDYASAVLWDDARLTRIDAPNEIWAARLGTVPVEGGLVSGSIRDAQALFNVNNLITDEGEVSKPDIEAFDRLLAALGINRKVGQLLADGMKKTEDKAAQPVKDADEIPLLVDLDPALFARLRPHLIALPQQGTRINVNTAPPEVVSAYLPATGVSSVIERIGSGTGRKVFTGTQDFGEVFAPLSQQEIDLHFDVKSSYFVAEGQARQGRATIRSQALLKREAAGGRMLWPRVIHVRMSP